VVLVRSIRVLGVFLKLKWKWKWKCNYYRHIMLITFRYSDDFIIYFSVSEQSVRLSNKRKAAKLTPTSSYNGTGLQMN